MDLVGFHTSIGQIAIIPFIIFFVRFVYFLIGLLLNLRKFKNLSHRINTPRQDLPLVSVLIPARNEEGRIGDCLKSIASSSYPSNLIELIIINDRSSDGTSQEISRYLSVIEEMGITNQHKIEVISDSQKSLPGKPGALQLGIEIAKGTLIMMTDADCTVSPDWVRANVELYLDSNRDRITDIDRPHLIASYTLMHQSTPFSKIQAVEWLYTHTMAAASNTLGMPLGCYGNNLTADSPLLTVTNGFKNIKFSVTEDLAMMQAADRMDAHIMYPCSPHTTVRTLPCRTFGEFLNQHHRWTKGGQALGWKAALFVVTTTAIVLGILLAAAYGEWLLAASYLGFRILLDTILILTAAIRLKEIRLIKWIPFSLLFVIVIETILPFLLLKKSVVWKDQEFNKKTKLH